MQHLEIERKFFVKELPDVSGLTPIPYERHILMSGVNYGLRVERKGSVYRLERKEEISASERTGSVIEITKEEYEELKKLSKGEIVRKGYIISENPRVSLKVYEGRFTGLARAEVQFSSPQEAEGFKPLHWMGAEITDTPLGKDAKLNSLSEKEFNDLVAKYRAL